MSVYGVVTKTARGACVTMYCRRCHRTLRITKRKHTLHVTCGCQ